MVSAGVGMLIQAVKSVELKDKVFIVKIHHLLKDENCIVKICYFEQCM